MDVLFIKIKITFKLALANAILTLNSYVSPDGGYVVLSLINS